MGEVGRVEGTGILETWLAGMTDSALVRTVLTAVVGPLLTVTGVVLLALVASRLGRRAIRRVVERAKEPAGGRSLELGAAGEEARQASARRAQRSEALGTLADSVVRAVVWGFAVLTALGSVGIDLAPLIAGAGIVGVAVGFGAQHLVRDLLAGVSMLLEDQYGVGDVIDVGEATGVVEAVGLRTTRLRDARGTVWHVPNGAITRVGNQTQGWSRAVVDVPVAHDVPVDDAERVLRAVLSTFAAAPEQGGVLLERPDLLGVEALTETGATFRVIVRTRPGEQWAVARRLRAAIRHGLDGAGIALASPRPAAAGGQAVGPPG